MICYIIICNSVSCMWYLLSHTHTIYFNFISAFPCFFRKQLLKVLKLLTLWLDLVMKRVEDNWERWSCSVPCVWSGSPQTRLALTLRMYWLIFDETHIKSFACRLDYFKQVLPLYSTGPVCPSWLIMCFTAMCVTTVATRTFLENKQVSAHCLPKTKIWNCF